jgi:glycosyltransferase involved in cell wall biosynthesis
VVTPLYHIEGRDDLIHDSSAIHYLIKPWAADNKVLVIYLYFNSIKQIHRYLNSGIRKMRDGYFYDVDGVKVALIEIQKIPKQGPVLLEFQSGRVVGFILECLKNNDFYPDVIVSHIPTASARALNDIFHDVKKIAILHNTDRIYWEKKKKNTEIIKRCFDHFFVRSKALYDYFSSEGLEKLGTDIIYSGVAGPVKTKNNGLKNKINIIYAGKLIALKNVDITIRAIEKLQNSNIYFHIVGDGNKRKSLEYMARKRLKSCKYKFYGHITREAVLDFFADMDIFIMASSPETFGLTYLEAMSNGCIPIGCYGEGIDGVIVDGENGFLVHPRNVDELKRKIQTIIEMGENHRKTIIDKAIETARLFNEYNMGMNYYRLIDDIYKHG